MQKILAVPHHLYVTPLTYGLVHDASPFVLLYDLPSANSIKLRNSEVDAAFISPVDYARGSSDYLILPGIAVSSKDDSEAVALFFRSGLSSISTIAVDIGVTSEIVLTRIILAEKYNINPQFIPMIPDLPAMLAKADAALLVGNTIFNLTGETNRLDPTDEWTDLTGLPYVHGFWGYRPNALNINDRCSLLHAREEGVQNLAAISREFSHPGISEDYLSRFSYTFNEEVAGSLSEFFRYSFYYGIIADIPEIRFDTTENESYSVSPD
jgi:chorismate dehydratase